MNKHKDNGKYDSQQKYGHGCQFVNHIVANGETDQGHNEWMVAFEITQFNFFTFKK